MPNWFELHNVYTYLYDSVFHRLQWNERYFLKLAIINRNLLLYGMLLTLRHGSSQTPEQRQARMYGTPPPEGSSNVRQTQRNISTLTAIRKEVFWLNPTLGLGYEQNKNKTFRRMRWREKTTAKVNELKIGIKRLENSSKSKIWQAACVYSTKQTSRTFLVSSN